MNKPNLQVIIFTFFSLCFFFSSETSAQLEKEYTYLDNSLEFREFLGHKLSQQDWAAEQGTDAMMARGADLTNKKLKGFIVENNESHWTLSYIGKRKFSEGVYYQINISTDKIIQDSYKDYSDKPVKLTDWQKSIFRATKTAKEADLLLCSNTYNSVVLPLTLGETKYLYTYLLAASNKPNYTVLGGHHRFIINENGNKIIQHKAHTKSCLNGEMIESIESQVVSHLNDPTPNEFHIYMSYLYDMPFYVWTPDGSLWKIHAGKITPVDTQEDGLKQQSPDN
jgi:hypothetical protein